MTVQEIIGLAVNSSLFLLVFALGLQATIDDALSLFRRPSLLLRSIVSMNVVMVAIAVAACLVFDLAPEVKVALVALALSPVPPILPGKQQQAGGTTAYSIGLLCTASAIAVILLPIVITTIDRVFLWQSAVPFAGLAQVVLISIFAPLATGILVKRFAPELARRVQKPVSIIARFVLLAAVIPVFVTLWPTFRAMLGHTGVLISLVGFTLIGTIVGHLLGGPHRSDRTVLALATGARHPGVAIAVATASSADARAVAVIVVYHLIIATLVVFPYVSARKPAHAGQGRHGARTPA